MRGKGRQVRKYKGSACPKSLAPRGERCSAGNPPQVLIAHPEPLIGKELMQRIRTHSIYRCTYCGVVYVNIGVPGMESILGYWTPQGFKAAA
jgi:hypothetical protein